MRDGGRVKSGDARHAELVRSLNRAAREASGLGVVFSEAVARRLGIAHTDLECIDVIAERGRVTAGDIARATGLTTGAVTGVIDRLERAGFAQRERDANDRRKVYVSMLPRAFERAGVYYESLEKAVDALTGNYNDSEIALLVDYLVRSRDLIRAEIEKLSAKPSPRKTRSPRR